jgi:HK97 gp10 family phage protein
MADGVTVTLKGDRDFVAAMKGLSEDLPNKFLRAAVRDAGAFLLGAILAGVPRLTGKLARNISVRTHQTAKTIRARVTVNTAGNADDPDNAFYWRFLEKGWHDRAGKAHSEPFIGPATESNEQAAAQIVIDSIGEALDRAEAKAR